MNARRAGFLAMGFLLLASLPTAVPQAPPPGPSGIHLAWGADPSTSMTVSWVSLPNPVARVEYGPTDTYGQSADAAPRPLPGDDVVAYGASLDALVPDTTYHYRVTVGTVSSEDLTFTTAPSEYTEPFTVAAWGDQGVPTTALGESDGDAPIRTTGLALAQDPAFHLIAGDLSYANGFSLTWDAYFEMLEPYAASRPFMAAVGNHEREAGQGFAQYDARLEVPNVGSDARWYAFRYGNALFVSLDTEHACLQAPGFDQSSGFVAAGCTLGINPVQVAYLEATLKAAREDPAITWIVAFHHVPVYSDGPHGTSAEELSPALRDNWAPLYEEYHVDVVVQAHDHFYERSKTISGGEAAPSGTTYVVAGVGGASHYAFTSPDSSAPEWEAARNDEDYGVVLLTFANETLHGEFRTLAGETFDAWTLRHDASGASVHITDEVVPDGGDRAVDPASEAPVPLGIMWVALVVAAALVRRSQH